MKKLLKWVGICFLAFFALGIIVNMVPSNSEKTVASTNETSTEEEPKTEEVKSAWNYFNKVDKMTEKKIYMAEAKSTNEIEFEFPYNGGSYFTLGLRKNDGPTEIMLAVSKGQFLHSIGDDRKVAFKFDDGKIYKYSYSLPSDGSADVMFVENSADIIKRLKNSKKVKVEAEFYDAGRQVIEFDVAGLDWKY